MKITRPDNKTKITTFDSLQELVDHIKGATITDLFKNRLNGPLSTQKERSHGWYGTDSLDEALELLRSGWVDKSKELEKKFNDRVKKQPETITRQRSVYDVVGGNCSVPRYLQGVPTNMVRQVRQPVKEKVITINYNISYNCDTTATKIMESAIDCLSYVKKLEDQGTRVNLNVYLITSDGWEFKRKSIFGYIVPIKKSSERLSIAKIAFTLCHASMLRRILISCIERDPDITQEYVYGYGSPIRNQSELKKIIPDAEFFG